MSFATTDVVVIGGGVIGASIAYHLAAQKVGVTLLERHEPAAGTSGACDGLVLLQSKKPGIHLQLALASRDRFDHLTEELDYDLGFHAGGGMVVIETEAEMRIMEQYVQKQMATGLDVQLLNGSQTRELEPALNEEIAGAAYCARDAQINPIYLNLGFINAAKRNGAVVHTGTEVTEIVTDSDRVTGVRTRDLDISTGVVVNATGVLADSICGLAGLEVPIIPRRGQILVTECLPPFLGVGLISAKYIAAKFDPTLARAAEEGISMDQGVSGQLLIGSTREFVGFDRSTTSTALKNIARNACRVIPRLKGVNIIRSYAGLRPYTPDGLPVLGRVEGFEGFIMAAGHEGDGIALSPITGQLIAELVVNGTPSISLEDFKLERFTGEKAAAGHPEH